MAADIAKDGENCVNDRDEPPLPEAPARHDLVQVIDDAEESAEAPFTTMMQNALTQPQRGTSAKGEKGKGAKGKGKCKGKHHGKSKGKSKG
eukprot:13937794-Alexandrium_andersonii.AAC.1